MEDNIAELISENSADFVFTEVKFEVSYLYEGLFTNFGTNAVEKLPYENGIKEVSELTIK